MKEIIKRFDNTKIYVSNYGKAYKAEKGYIIELKANRTAKKLTISLGSGAAGRMNLDSLVWRVFKGVPEGLSHLHITHLDGDLDNNRLDNLDMPQLKTKREKETVTISATKYEEMLQKIEAYESKQQQMEME